jgi:hypothetical protein
MKIDPVLAELFHAEGRIDRHDVANCRFSPSLQTRVKNVPLQFYVGCCTSLYRSFVTKVSQIKIWNFFVISEERNVCRCPLNRYSVTKQFGKLVAGQQLCHRRHS